MSKSRKTKEQNKIKEGRGQGRKNKLKNRQFSTWNVRLIGRGEHDGERDTFLRGD